MLRLSATTDAAYGREEKEICDSSPCSSEMGRKNPVTSLRSWIVE
jgi:hypothetical protein